MISGKTCIVVPVRNQPQVVSTLLSGLEGSEAWGCEQVFVDDASDNDTRMLLLEYVSRAPHASYLRNDKQQLFTRTVNRGIRAAQPNTDYYVLVNTDCELKPGWLNRMFEGLQRHDNVAIIGYKDGTPENGTGEEEAIHPRVDGSPDYITGHCILIPRSVFERIGLFCETDPSQAHISSERNWCWLAADTGYTMFYLNSDLCVHDKGGPSWNRNIPWLFNQYDYSNLWRGRNRL